MKREIRANKVIDIVIRILFILSILAAVSMVFTFVSNDFDYRFINIFGYSIGSTSGESMLPIINKNKVIVKHEKYEEIKIGDIVVFYKYVDYEEKEILVGHRVYDITDDGLITTGDNNDYIDEWTVYPQEVIGRVVHVIDSKTLTETASNTTR